mgnify:CR=1 FL=1|tara:strand:- start:653 stop:1036 length:384 start_codon:yes stop_codon:yes gene_type:complete
MSKKQDDSKELTKATLTELLLNINDRLSHMEDCSLDTRSVLVKLVKQSNEVVQFLKQIDIENDEQIDYEDMMNPTTSFSSESVISSRTEKLKDLIDEYMDKQQDLKEFEEELKKHKKDISPGQIGEA